MTFRNYIVALVVLFTAGINGQTAPKRVTVVTVKGDVIEGVIKRSTETVLSIEVAGQLLNLPLDTLKYVSFVGQIDSTGPVVTSTQVAAPLSAALAGLRELQIATEIGVLRAQYSDKLVSTLAPVKEFLSQRDGSWVDVKVAMNQAVSAYTSPLSSIEAWKYASTYFAAGHRWAVYAATLAASPNEATHEEDPSEQKIEPRGSFAGRLGSGDRPLPKDDLGNGFLGGPSDLLSFDLSAPANFDAEMTCKACNSAGLVLFDGANKKIDSDSGRTGHIKTRLVPGHYFLVAATSIGQVGAYEVSFK